MLATLNECQTFIIILCIGLMIFYIQRKEPFSNLNRAPKVEFPFRNIQDQNGKNLNIIALGAPFRSDKHKELFRKYKNGISNNRGH